MDVPPLPPPPRLLSLSVSSEQFLVSDNDGRATHADNGCERRGVHQNVLARGLARRYGDQKGRSEALLAKVSRHKKQLAILVEYNRRKEAEGGGRAHEQQSGRVARDLNATVMVAPQKGSSHFPRNTSLRVLADNQESEKEEELVHDWHSPTEEDVARFAALAADVARVSPSAKMPSSAKEPAAASVPKSPSRAREGLGGGSSNDKSSAQVLCELQVTKEIVVREQTLQHLRQLVVVLNTLADELSTIAAKREAASALLTAASSSPIREKRGSSSSLTVTPLATRRPESGHVSAAVVERDMKELAKQFDERADTARHRVHQFKALLETLRDASMNAADAIVEWRRFRQRRCRFTNFQPLYRFPWRKLRVANYLTHMTSDVDFLFETAALQLVVGADLARNALLLPRSQLERLGFAERSFVSTTFLTERRDRSDAALASASSLAAVPAHKLEQHYKVLLEAMAGSESQLVAALDNERAQRCLAILRREQELESDEAEKDETEQRRVAEAYNPFATIKAAGGVEESLTQVLTAQAPHVAALSQQLRRRQEDTARAILLPTAPERESDSAGSPVRLAREPSERLRVNSRRLVQMLEKRKEQSTTASECEARSVHAWGVTNKLPGQVVMRKLTVRRQQNQHARKIQLQFRIHRLRREVLQGLARFVMTTRESAVHIQRIFRGYCAKKRYDVTKMLLEVERRRVAAARTILHAYRRYKRRLRHHRPMTVEAIAQAQLFCIQYQKLQEESDEDAVDRYRRVGEERRRQRVALLQRRRMEQLELEQRRNACATTIQACVRAHLAKCELAHLRKEKKAHATAMCIMSLQSNVRRFLRRQEARRERFRQDLERVNRSAVRIQSIYRGYNSRASLVGQVDDAVKGRSWLGGHSREHSEDNDEDSEDDAMDSEPKEKDDRDRLPPLDPRLSRRHGSHDDDDDDETIAMLSSTTPVSSKTEYATKLPPLRATTMNAPNTPAPALPPAAAAARRPSINGGAMTRVELRLKEPMIGDDFDSGVTSKVTSERRRSSVSQGGRVATGR